MPNEWKSIIYAGLNKLISIRNKLQCYRNTYALGPSQQDSLQKTGGQTMAAPALQPFEEEWPCSSPWDDPVEDPLLQHADRRVMHVCKLNGNLQ